MTDPEDVPVSGDGTAARPASAFDGVPVIDDTWDRSVAIATLARLTCMLAWPGVDHEKDADVAWLRRQAAEAPEAEVLDLTTVSLLRRQAADLSRLQEELEQARAELARCRKRVAEVPKAAEARPSGSRRIGKAVRAAPKRVRQALERRRTRSPGSRGVNG